MLRLSRSHHKRAVNDTLQAAILLLRHAPVVHYTEGGLRWQGIDRRLIAANGHFPNWADCSAAVTWYLWNGLHVHQGHSDVVNAQHWRGGFTGTMEERGTWVSRPAPADAVMYHGHTALYTGGGLVVSHGSEAGPLLLPVHYRSDVRGYLRFFTT